MAGKACHVLRSTARLGLTLALGANLGYGMRILAVLVAVALSGCSTSIPFALSPEATVHVTVLGTPGNECIIEPHEDAHRRLRHWLAANRAGWSQLHSTPPSGGVLLTAPELRLHLHGATAYVTVPDGILMKQVSESE